MHTPFDVDAFSYQSQDNHFSSSSLNNKNNNNTDLLLLSPPADNVSVLSCSPSHSSPSSFNFEKIETRPRSKIAPPLVVTAPSVVTPTSQPEKLSRIDTTRTSNDQAYFGYSHDKLVARFVTKLLRMDLSNRGSIALTEFLAGVEKEPLMKSLFASNLSHSRSEHPLVIILTDTVAVLKRREQGRKVKEIFKDTPRFVSAFLHLR